MKKLILMVMVVISLGGTTGWYWRSEETPPRQFPTVNVTRGRPITAINATGILESEDAVTVSAHVTGRIESLGTDSADETRVIRWGSVVKKGAVLAQIENSLYQAQVTKAQAELRKCVAEQVQKQALLAKAEGDWRRAQTLFPRATISAAEYDNAQAAYEVAKASIDISKAQIQTAEVALALARADLANTTITSPIDGVVIEQRIRVGEMVSATGPRLFVIAKVLGKMEVRAMLAEVDAGRIQIGQPVRLTVDALQGAVYHGSVIALGRFSSQLSNGNASSRACTVSVSVDNTDGKLTPYLTAQLSFVVQDPTN